MKKLLMLLGITIMSCVPVEDEDLPSSSPTVEIPEVCFPAYGDSDGDGYGNAAYVVEFCDGIQEGYVLEDGDCDDLDPEINPGMDEVCDEIDNDCDGIVDGSSAVDAKTWYLDADEDGYGNQQLWIFACSPSSEGYVSINGDCDDEDATTYPNAPELCDDIDNDCDGNVDEDVVDLTWYMDTDRDGYGSSSTTVACSKPDGNYIARGGDCDDSDPAINPGEDEVCNEVDDDCDGQVDMDTVDAVTWYFDGDQDGYGSSSTTVACSKPDGYVAQAGDCDDSDPAINPGEDEVCNEVDDDCDGQVDEGLIFSPWYQDADGDGYGTGSETTACSKPDGYVAQSGDCDDEDATTYPNAPELCDDIDNDCDGQIDENVIVVLWYLDQDADGYGAGSTTSAWA